MQVNSSKNRSTFAIEYLDECTITICKVKALGKGKKWTKPL